MVEPFKVVVADPAWLFFDKLPGETRGASKQYDCMSTYDICKLSRMIDVTTQDDNRKRFLHMIMNQPIADDAILFLWRVAAMQQSALDVARAWGFTVKTDLVWLKKTSNGLQWFGMGRTLRAEHETCLVCTKGAPELLNHSTRSTFITDFDLTGFSAKVGRHSEKPEVFFEIVERFVKGPYLELFARRTRPGWTCIGNEL